MTVDHFSMIRQQKIAYCLQRKPMPGPCCDSFGFAIAAAVRCSSGQVRVINDACQSYPYCQEQYVARQTVVKPVDVARLVRNSARKSENAIRAFFRFFVYIPDD